MLTSAQLDSASPLAVLLLGQPQLRASMRLGVLAALDQRIGVRYAMAAMTPGETVAYLQHHTKLAGRSDQLFSDDAAELIHQAGRGFPRAVNRLAAAGAPRVWWRLDSPQMLWSGWLLSSTVPPPDGTAV